MPMSDGPYRGFVDAEIPPRVMKLVEEIFSTRPVVETNLWLIAKALLDQSDVADWLSLVRIEEERGHLMEMRKGELKIRHFIPDQLLESAGHPFIVIIRTFLNLEGELRDGRDS